MITTLIASLMLGGSPQQDRKVTLDMVAMTLDKAAEVLSNATGERYIATPTIKSEVLIVSVKDVPASVLRAKIAKTLNAYIEQKDGVWYIGKSTQQIKAENDFDEADKNDRLAKLISKTKERLNQEKPFDRNAAEFAYRELEAMSNEKLDTNSDKFSRRIDQLNDMSPDRRAVARLVAKLPIEMFTKLKIGSPVVFSNRPTRMQAPLPVRVDDVLGQFAAECNVWADVAKGANFRGPIGPGGETYYMGQLAARTKPLASAPQTMLVKCSLNWRQDLALEVLIADARDKIVGESTYSFGNLVEQNAPVNPKKEAKLKDKVQLSAIAKKYQAWTNIWDRRPMEKGEVSNPDPIFFQPELRDPLSYGASEVLIDFAKQTGTQLVANPVDSMLMLPDMPNFDRLMMSRWLAVERVEEDGWNLFFPKNRTQERRERMNRDDLGKLVRIFQNEPKLTIEQEASFSFAIPDPDEGYKPMISVLEAAKGDRRFLFNDLKSLRLIGSLTPQERKQAAANPKGVPVTQLNEKARLLIQKYVYSGEEYAVQFEPTTAEGEALSPDMWDLYFNGLKKEPTCSLPNGIPPGATLKISDFSEDVVKTGPMQRKAFLADTGRFLNAADLAFKVFSQTRPDLYPAEQEDMRQINADDLRLFQKRDLTLVVSFPGGLKMTKQASQAAQTSTEKFSKNNLPTPFKAAYDEAYKRLVERAKQSVPPQF